MKEEAYCMCPYGRDITCHMSPCRLYNLETVTRHRLTVSSARNTKDINISLDFFEVSESLSVCESRVMLSEGDPNSTSSHLIGGISVNVIVYKSTSPGGTT